jgi:hypothetical protein
MKFGVDSKADARTGGPGPMTVRLFDSLFRQSGNPRSADGFMLRAACNDLGSPNGVSA